MMRATYRIQLTPELGFAEVRRLLPYFSQLGVSHLYLSPITEAHPGSEHGYDVIDHNSVRNDFGGREEFERLREGARTEGLGLVLDIVPNHAYVGPKNTYWQDVLAYGPHSPYARYFDIEWYPLKPELQEKILLPFLGDPYGQALENGDIELRYRNGRIRAGYYDNEFSLSPASYPPILHALLDETEGNEIYWDVKNLLDSYETLHRGEREKAETLARRLDEIAQSVEFEAILQELDQATLHQILEQQFWRLSFWKTASYEVNYRRFFDINELVALRMEDDEVFWDAHRLIGELLAEEGVDGVRVDHIDGLFNPHKYLQQLRELGDTRIWVEKILSSRETLPDHWNVDGTTGYRFLNDVMGLLVEPEGRIPLRKIYQRYCRDATRYDEVVRRSKHLVMNTSLASERYRLAYGLDRIAEEDYHTRDFTLVGLREALSDILASLDRYRTYLPHETETAEEVIRTAVHRAQQHNPATEPTVFHFIRDVILGELDIPAEGIHRAWTGRFQQYTGPVAAKGVEDTAFYRYLRLAALNEVGGEPNEFSQSRHAFHAHARFRIHNYPNNLLATGTHDHKRGPDTRMRMIALSAVPDEWEELVQKLDQVAEDHRGLHGPDDFDTYLFYQTLVGLWNTEADSAPSLEERLWDYMRKAARESKRKTSWINPNASYEEDLETFVRRMMNDQRTKRHLDAFIPDIQHYGFRNSLAQTVLKFTSPGTPDIYQGCELFDYSLVDPDNRRPVDYEKRHKLLDELEPLLQNPDTELVSRYLTNQDERLKLFVTSRLLRFRAAHPDLFRGEYQSLDISGEDEEQWVAFTQYSNGQHLIVVVRRFPSRWDQSDPADATIECPTVASGTYTDQLTGKEVEVENALSPETLPLPWAVLHKQDSDGEE